MSTRRRRTVIAAVVLVAIVSMLGPAWIHARYDAKIIDRLMVEVDRGEKEFPLKELTDFEWDEVCLLLPYFRKEYIEEATGVKSKDWEWERLGIGWWWWPGSSEANAGDQWTLVFLNEKRYVKAINFISGVIDYDTSHLGPVFDNWHKLCWSDQDQVTIHGSYYANYYNPKKPIAYLTSTKPVSDQ